MNVYPGGSFIAVFIKTRLKNNYDISDVDENRLSAIGKITYNEYDVSYSDNGILQIDCTDGDYDIIEVLYDDSTLCTFEISSESFNWCFPRYIIEDDDDVSVRLCYTGNKLTIEEVEKNINFTTSNGEVFYIHELVNTGKTPFIDFRHDGEIDEDTILNVTLFGKSTSVLIKGQN